MARRLLGHAWEGLVQPYVLDGKKTAADAVRRVTSGLLERTETDGGPNLEELVHAGACSRRRQPRDGCAQ
ncbi:hypothetical protein LZC95_35415 [Pendulispora brunnea]|uniref:Uncharacterized protein n=1 Tax=Pendulispora brunnea TaxID=2905690 RepID=A0ABZ2JZ15_9BACT